MLPTVRESPLIEGGRDPMMVDHSIDESLAWDKRTVAQKLSVSERTVARLVDRGELTSVHIGRSIRIPVRSVYELLDSPALKGDNHSCAGSVVQEKSTCHISANKREVKASSGGHRSPMQTASELESLLEQHKRGRP